VGSARYLEHLGFPALATTSAGFAFSQGRPDSADEGVAARDRTLAHVASIAAAVDLPVNADFMSGFGREPEDVAESVALCVATGIAGLSIEDATGERSPLCSSCRSRSSASAPLATRSTNQAPTCS
jgi:2-methylisocitrate lyase-like PEP mutase family enzyme